jgi:hypothetical protein
METAVKTRHKWSRRKWWVVCFVTMLQNFIEEPKVKNEKTPSSEFDVDSVLVK